MLFVVLQQYRELKSKIERVEYKLPAAHDKVSMLQEYEIPSKMEEREKLLVQVHNKYHDVMRLAEISYLTKPVNYI